MGPFVRIESAETYLQVGMRLRIWKQEGSRSFSEDTDPYSAGLSLASVGSGPAHFYALV